MFCGIFSKIYKVNMYSIWADIFISLTHMFIVTLFA